MATQLRSKARWIWEQTLLIHKLAPETRLASSLSPLEIFTVLYYGGILDFRSEEPLWEGRDRFVISKGHGSISMYPILSDLGFFPPSEIETVCRKGSILGGIPDPVIPGYESVNGSLGHGLGVASGMALGLKRKNSASSVFVMTGDGELNEGANWEAIMFAGHHGLDNLVLIVDNNRVSMLDRSERIVSLEPLEEKFKVFGWEAIRGDGHDLESLPSTLAELKRTRGGKPKAFIADTVKGHGVPAMEESSLSHVMSLKPEEVDRLIAEGGPYR